MLRSLTLKSYESYSSARPAVGCSDLLDGSWLLKMAASKRANKTGDGADDASECVRKPNLRCNASLWKREHDTNNERPNYGSACGTNRPAPKKRRTRQKQGQRNERNEPDRRRERQNPCAKPERCNPKNVPSKLITMRNEVHDLRSFEEHDCSKPRDDNGDETAPNDSKLWMNAHHLTRSSSATAGGSELCCGV